MPKNIVFCADGTWNGPGMPDSDSTAKPITNVFKLFLNLDGKDLPGTMLLAREQERQLTDADGAVVQAAKYLHGVGDSSNFLVQALGGGIGAGLIERIVRGYTFVSRNYVAGDRIFLIGFSRGAYTARALAGLIAGQGLLDATTLNLDDKPMAYRLGAAVWFDYRRQKGPPADADWFGRLQNIVADLPAFLQAPPSAARVAATMAAVAVWDTVGALGIPEFSMSDRQIDVFQFADRALSAKVAAGLHAVAVDEQRADFSPTLWDADPARIAQALFPGAHADVGGGYPTNESGLSDGALAWMIAGLTNFGVRFAAEPTYVPAPDPAGPSHRPWEEVPWTLLPRAARAFPSGLFLSQPLVARLGGPGYAPPNLGLYWDSEGPLPGVAMG
jgi:uncharacterized protein (DUF2235 family)